MAKIIIGIHGLGNKPPKKILKQWWKKAIQEGMQSIGYPRLFFKFELVYWAHILHPKPLDPGEKDKESPFFVMEPYTPADKSTPKEPEKWREKVLNFLERQLEKVLLNEDMTINFSSITDFILKRYFKDLNSYYSDEILEAKYQRPAREVIREELAKVLRKHRRKEILLIAHSMGTIVAYDVLIRLAPDVKIDTFVTIGSPLGLPVVMIRIAAEQTGNLIEKSKPQTPQNVLRSWHNFSDLQDNVAMNYNLHDDFEENSHQVRAMDYVIFNDYEHHSKRNPHKVYGYLRTPGLAEVIDSFLNYGKKETIIRVTQKINGLFTREFGKLVSRQIN